VEPVGDRVGRRGEEADPGGDDEHPERGGRGPPAPGDQQVHHEDQGRQLDRGRDAEAHPPPPAAGAPEQVTHHEGEQHDVDLPEVEGGAHRVQARREDGEQHRHHGRGTGRHPDAARAAVHDVAQ
jgi:hypothetical protein